MKFKIGFQDEPSNSYGKIRTDPEQSGTIVPRRSVVQVHFPGRSGTLAYYNDRFDLQPGDLVYVDGRLEGKQGRITEVNYNFKIKLADYKRVIALVDTAVTGKFYHAGSHFVTFDPDALPVPKVLSWFKAPAKDDDEFITGDDDTSFRLGNLWDMNVGALIAERGHDYYLENRVRYISICGTHGYAIVEGGDSYEVEFDYQDGEIRHLTCSCFCSYHCKHEFAAMLQLKDTLDWIEKHDSAEYRKSGYFAAVCKETLFRFAVDGKRSGTFSLG